MRYIILPYTKAQAKKLGVKIYPSKNPNKKIDVFKNGRYVTSVGANGYLDYPTYRELLGKKYADERRRLYKKRHEKDRKIKYSAGWYADRLLW